MAIYKFLFVSVLSITSVLSMVSATSIAKELQYFEDKIDYWGNGPLSLKQDVVESPVVSKQTEKESFPWRTYLDPKNKEFFKEGDYTPPEPFMEIARNPSDENIKNWFEFQRKKNELSARLQSRMQEYLAQVGSSVTSQRPQQELKLELKQEPQRKRQEVLIDPSRFQLRMYFDSHCPHCKKMFAVLRRLQDEGYKVEALQVDDGPVSEGEKVISLGKANPMDLKKHGAKGVPFLLIADLKRKALLPKVEGFHEYEEIIELLHTASRS